MSSITKERALSSLLESKDSIFTQNKGASLRLSCDLAPRSLVVGIIGPLDTEISMDFLYFLQMALEEAAKVGGLLVDMSETRYVSSTGIGALSSAMMEYEHASVPFALRSVPPKIRSLFEMLGLWGYFRVLPGAEE